LPENRAADLRQPIEVVSDGQKMVARELPGFAGKSGRAVGEQDLGFADAARIDDNLTRCRIAGGVLIADAKVAFAQRYLARLPAPPRVDELVLIRQ
jgi:hypothetical protein